MLKQLFLPSYQRMWRTSGLGSDMKFLCQTPSFMFVLGVKYPGYSTNHFLLRHRRMFTWSSMQININPYPCCFWHCLSNMIRPFLPLAFGVSFAYWFKKCWGRKWKLMVCFFLLFCTFFFSICKICFEQRVLWKWIMMMITITIIKITHLIMKKSPLHDL